MSGGDQPADRRRRGMVMVGLDCVPTRSALDPTAWVVLEELVMAADTATSAATVCAATSVRVLADQLGLSKDTVASALRRLASTGIVRREDDRDGGSGRFGHSRYVVNLTSTGLGLAVPANEPQPSTSDTVIALPDPSRTSAAGKGAALLRPQRTRARRTTDDLQLSLLDPEPTPS